MIISQLDWSSVITIILGAVAVLAAVLVLRDAREQRRAHGALRATEQYSRAIIESLLDMIIATDNERRIVEFNPAAEEVFGYTRQEIIGQNVTVLYADAEQSRAVRQALLDKGQFTGEILNKRKDGETFSSFLTASVLRLANGEQFGVVGVSRDITDRKRVEEKLRFMGMHDALTGLYNRAHFEEELDQLERANRRPVSVIMADMDGLKRVNDSLGHAEGDRLLQQVAAVLKATFRADDVVARIGGDEFAVLLPDANEGAAERALQRLRLNVDKYNAYQPTPRLSLSLGLATANSGAVLRQALKQADERMYQDKSKHTAMI